MTDVRVPTIPLSLQHLPTVGGLVVPWITPRTADGRYIFGSVDRDRMGHALITGGAECVDLRWSTAPS